MSNVVLIAVPTFENISPETFKSIYNLTCQMGDLYQFEFVKGYDCARARNQIAKLALDRNPKTEIPVDYIFMVDSDIILPEDALINLLQFKSDVVLGYYPRKNDSKTSEIFGKSLIDPYANSNKLSIDYLKSNRAYNVPRFEINGGGFGCALIDTAVFSKLSYPYFKYVNYEDGQLLSEDLYFCNQVRGRGMKIEVDTRVGCKHIKKEIIDC